jgi:hypothetical protein
MTSLGRAADFRYPCDSEVANSSHQLFPKTICSLNDLSNVKCV